MRRRTLRTAWLQAMAIVVAVLAGISLANPSSVRVLVGFAVITVFVALALRTPRAVLMSLVGWLVALGLIRRLTDSISHASSFGDPLVLVGSAAWLLLAAVAISRGALRERTVLTRFVLALMFVLALSAINPAQGGLTVGIAGIAIVVLPMFAFLVGRELVTDAVLERMFAVTIVLALVSAGYGLIQTFHGFPSWDQRWIDTSGVASLHVGSAIRPFANFSAASEYVTFLAAAFITVVGSPRRLPLLAVLGTAGVLAAGIWFGSARGVVVLTTFAAILVLGVRLRLSFGRAILSALAAFVALTFALGHIGVSPDSSSSSGSLAAHQLAGLSHPFGQDSTLSAHYSLLSIGLREAFRRPLGSGIGVVTSAASKYGNASISTEADPSNAAVAAGALGLALYLGTAVIGFRRMYRRAQEGQRRVDRIALGWLAVVFLQWLNGGQYAVIFMPWLILGWLDRPSPAEVSTGLNPRAAPDVSFA